MYRQGIKEGQRQRGQEQQCNRHGHWTTLLARETNPCCRISARQPSIGSKPQRLKRDRTRMLQKGETCRPCARARISAHLHTASLHPKQRIHPLHQNNNNQTHTQPSVKTETQSPTYASLNQSSQNSLAAFQHVSLRSDQSLND